MVLCPLGLVGGMALWCDAAVYWEGVRVLYRYEAATLFLSRASCIGFRVRGIRKRGVGLDWSAWSGWYLTMNEAKGKTWEYLEVGEL